MDPGLNSGRRAASLADIVGIGFGSHPGIDTVEPFPCAPFICRVCVLATQMAGRTRRDSGHGGGLSDRPYHFLARDHAFVGDLDPHRSGSISSSLAAAGGPGWEPTG